MSASRTPGYSRLNKNHKFSIAGVAALGAAALTFSLVPSNASAEADTRAVDAVAPVAWAAAADSAQAKTVHTSITQQQVGADKVAKAVAEARAKADAKAKADAQAKAAAAAKAKADAKAKAEAKKRADERAAASRAAARKPVFANNLDGWIREALSIMKAKGIPGTYEGLHRNIIRESAGDPRAINNWDINAQNGVPSIGLLQVIKPTFDAYHVPGTAHSQYDPVANLTAAANYAADRYGSIDNVNSAY
ncbi:transglycosylase SLT domain-containing protein [Streptomyces sp. ISL-100]|uniref:transglycosylase SLT domain-containing protein n=1 Tax=Streptomyces sp. ISL-100 TaxID=2819173 RepID=UPI001BEC9595|nr:transglycosylase SLT domain-containing protein [Streptomyces sp. ISL-100]MBT2401660.1 transglycosylase SLT domain-containing protein [Streptomyces sp. ISL-100]